MSQHLEVVSDYKELPAGKFLYFASDFHLGTFDRKGSDERERIIVKWLGEIQSTAASVFLVGDIFDFWFEYKNVIPKGFIRFQAKLLELRDAGIPIHIFTGNHDTWFFDYFPSEFGIPIHRRPIVVPIGEQMVLIGHGDGLGPGDGFYKFLKKIFEGKLPQFLFRWLHPDVGVFLAQKWSKSSRISSSDKDMGLQSKEQEWLWQYAKDMEQSSHFDYYIFGHRHIPMQLEVNENSTYINLGEWVNHRTYVKHDGSKAELLTYNP